MCFIYCFIIIIIIIIMLLKNNSQPHASLKFKNKNKKKCHKINPNFQGVQMFSNINCLISKAKTLFVQNMLIHGRIYNIDIKIITLFEAKHL